MLRCRVFSKGAFASSLWRAALQVMCPFQMLHVVCAYCQPCSFSLSLFPFPPPLSPLPRSLSTRALMLSAYVKILMRAQQQAQAQEAQAELQAKIMAVFTR